MKNNYDPALMKKAKEMASGTLGKELAKFPLRFSTAAFFASRPFSSPKSVMKNGTVSLINLGGRPIAITCHHVLEGYRRELDQDKKIIFQIGNLEIDPLKHVIDENQDLDLVTIDLSQQNIKEIGQGNEIASDFFHPASWPPKDVNEGEFVAFGGWPGRWRWQASEDKIVFDSFSSGAQMVTSVREDYFVCQFEREYWITAFKVHPYEDLHDIAGLSGAPVFIWRNINFEFVGVVYQFSSEFDLMYVRHSKFIHENGTISR